MRGVQPLKKIVINMPRRLQKLHVILKILCRLTKIIIENRLHESLYFVKILDTVQIAEYSILRQQQYDDTHFDSCIYLFKESCT